MDHLDRSSVYAWLTMGSQVLLMIFIIPVATVNLGQSSLALWLSALLLVSLSSVADFGVYNTIVRTLPFVKSGKSIPEFSEVLALHNKNIHALEDEAIDVDDIPSKINSLVAFGLKQILFSSVLASIIGLLIGYFMYQGRSDSFLNLNFIFTIFFYWLVIPTYALGRFFESILLGSDQVSKAKKNESISVLLRTVLMGAFILSSMPIFWLGLIHFLSCLIQLVLNIFCVSEKPLRGFKFTNFQKYLSQFSVKDRSNFTKGQYRFGVNLFSTYIIMNAGPIAVTGMKSDETVSFYLILVRMLLVVKQFAQVPLIVSVPQLVKYRSDLSIKNLLDMFSKRGAITIALYLIGLPISLFYIYLLFNQSGVDYLYYWFLLSFIIFLELNHSNHAQLVLTKNVQPFLIPSFLAAGLCATLMFPIFDKFGIIGIIFLQGAVQLICSNWYSIYLNVKEFNNLKLIFYKS